jgi:tyrosine-protein phosphatase YwqE
VRSLTKEQVRAASKVFYDHSSGCSPRTEVLHQLAEILAPVDKPSVEQTLIELATQSVIALFKNGDVIMPDYHNRIKIPSDLVQRIYSQINQDEVVRIMGTQINEMVATKITNAMVTEITSDVKHVLSHAPTRERLRLVVATEIEKIKVENGGAR